MNSTGRPWLAALTRAVARVVGSMVLSVLAVSLAHACACEAASPRQGFERAQYVFTGTVVEAIDHSWTVDVDRVWKGSANLAPRVRLLDVYAGIDCASYFEPGRAYLFFAIVAKSSRYVYYQPQVCNWTSALRSRRVPGAEGPVWLEEFIIETYGSGEPPHAEDPWKRRASDNGASGSTTGLLLGRIVERQHGRRLDLFHDE
jgi:hypothetical protein